MIQASGARNQQELLDISGFSLGLASKWKKRGSVPDKAIAQVSKVTGVSFEWIKTGAGMMSAGTSQAAESGGRDGRELDPEIASQVMADLDKIEAILGEALSNAKRGTFFVELYNRKKNGEKISPSDLGELLKRAN